MKAVGAMLALIIQKQVSSLPENTGLQHAGIVISGLMPIKLHSRNSPACRMSVPRAIPTGITGNLKEMV
jgi:hypothetical protein